MKNRMSLSIFLLSFILLLTNLSVVSIRGKKNKKFIYNCLYRNEYIDDSEFEELFCNIKEDFHLDDDKIISNKFNYLYYLFNLEKYNNSYYNYLSTLTGDYLNMPDLEDMVPQGLTCCGDYVIVSAYDANRFCDSCLFVINKNDNYIKRVDLDNNSHVGGIAYDYGNDLLWVTVNDRLYGYGMNDVLFGKEIVKKYTTSSIDNIDKCSFLNYKGGKLYIGNYDLRNNSVISVYKLSKNERNGNISFVFDKSLTIPSKTQGIDFLKIDNQEYLVLSRSWYIFDDSELLVYKYSDDISNYTNNYVSMIKCPPMMEEIKVTDKNGLFVLYESGAYKYRDCLINMNNIYCSDIKKKIRK